MRQAAQRRARQKAAEQRAAMRKVEEQAEARRRRETLEHEQMLEAVEELRGTLRHEVSPNRSSQPAFWTKSVGLPDDLAQALREAAQRVEQSRQQEVEHVRHAMTDALWSVCDDMTDVLWDLGTALGVKDLARACDTSEGVVEALLCAAARVEGRALDEPTASLVGDLWILSRELGAQIDGCSMIAVRELVDHS